MERFGKKIITILLSISMLMTFTPTVAFAADMGSYDAQDVTDEVTEPSTDLLDDAETGEPSEDPQDGTGTGEEPVDLTDVTEVSEPAEVPAQDLEEPAVGETPAKVPEPGTMPDGAKFMVRVTSTPIQHSMDEAGYVTGIVYDNFKGELTVTDGWVHRSNVKVEVAMQNVASLGITTPRSYVRNIVTGMDAPNDNPLSQIQGVFAAIPNTTVVASVENGHSVTYTVKKNGTTVNADPDTEDNARTVWHEIVNSDHVIASTSADEDSWALIKAGSYLQVEDKILKVKNDLKINNLNDLSGMDDAIRAAVEYTDAGNKIVGVKAYMAKETELKLGQTYAKVVGDCITITSEDIPVSGDMKTALSQLQTAQDNNAMINAVLTFLGACSSNLKDRTTHVEFAFDHHYGTPEYVWSDDYSKCTATRTCVDCGFVDTETVDATITESDNSFPFEGKVKTHVATFNHAGLEPQTYVAPGEYKDFKFAISVSSKASNGTVGAVTGIVYPNYTGVLNIGTGQVNQNNVTIGVWMKDVASLNVQGIRHYERSLQTGMQSADHSLNYVVNLFKDLEEATVIAKVKDGPAVTYTIVNNGNTITATPGKESNARTVWHEIVNSNHVEASTDENEDSWAVIKAGSYLQVEDKVLLAEQDVRVDNLNDVQGLNNAIRAAVVYKDADQKIDGVKLFLEEGTELNMGTSYAKVASNCLTITADVAATAELQKALSDLQSAENVNDMMLAVFGGINGFCSAINETSTTVTFSFDHKITPVEKVAATCTEDGHEAYYQCQHCGKMFSDEAGTTVITEPTVITKLGHAYGAPKYKWSADHKSCTATRICANDNKHVETETVSNIEPKTETKPFPYNGTTTTYTANFENKAFAPQVYTDLGQDQDFKFAVSVSSKATDGTVGAVTGIVYPNYQGVLTIGQGKVSQNNVTVDVWMRNVASLGVNGERHYTRSLNTGLTPADHSLDKVKELFSGLEEATVIAKVDGGSAVTYTIVNEGNVITATPGKESKAREVWQQIVNEEHVLAGVDDNEDSYAVIKAGSYIQVEDAILLAEQDVTVNDLNNMEALNEAIRNAVVYKTADKPIQGVKLYLAKDTELNMGASYAKVKEECLTITADVAATAQMKEALSSLQNAGGVDGMILASFAGIKEFCEAINETTTTVTFYFGHDMKKHAATDATCEATGNPEYYECLHCGRLFTSEAGTTEFTGNTVLPATGHVWGEPTYTWNADYSKCTAERICAKDSTHKETETVDSTKAVENKDFPYNGKVTTYTATFKNVAFVEQKMPITENGQDFKFAVSVSSKASDNTVGAVTGIVYPNYQGVLTIGEGKVNRSNVTVEFWMKDVASLGVQGVRNYSRSLETGMTGDDNDLSAVKTLFADLHEATVIAKVKDGSSVTYTVTNTGNVITATPASETNARNVWHEIVNEKNIAHGTGDENSSALIKAGSYLQIQDKVLYATSDVVIDNLDDLKTLNEAIRGAVEYREADKAIEGVKLYLAKDTMLHMGSSYASVLQECMSITSDVPATAEMQNALAGLQSATNTSDMVLAVFGGITGFCGAIDGKTTTVEFAFGHQLTEHAAVDATCEEAGNTAYYECETCGKFFSDAEGKNAIAKDSWIVKALGHAWGTPTYTWSDDREEVVGVAICSRNPAHIVVDKGEPVKAETPATCTEAGEATYTATFTKEPFTTQKKTETIPALGHDWDEINYVWADDNSKVTATAVCKRDSAHNVEKPADTTEEVITNATCLTQGVKTLTATFTEEPFTTQTKTVVIPAKGHDWDAPTYTWSQDYKTCTATRICKNDPKHIESETVNTKPDVVPENFPLDGYTTTYTATFNNPDFAEQTSEPIKTESRDYKFATSVSSVAKDGKVGSVTGIVYPDYQGVLSINGDTVNSGNVKVGFWMKNVESLGVEGERSYERSLTTGMADNDYPLSLVQTLFSGLHESTVIAKVEGGHTVTYTVVNEGKKITATPASENNARSVWHEIVNKENIDYGTDTTDDSSALIKAGSYIQVEDMILLAEQDVQVDNLDALEELKDGIRNAVVYKTADKPIEGVKIHVAQGTRLDMGTSYAEWKQNCMSITADVAATQQMKDALQGLKSAADTTGMLKAVFTGISQFCGAIDDKTTTVVFSFGHELTKHEEIKATCEEAGSKEYYECENCGKLFSDSEGKTELTGGTEIPALGHDWNAPTYSWAEDHSTCTATKVCKRDDSHVVTEEGKVSSVVTEPTCTEDGKTVYTATFEKEGFVTQTEEVKADKLGHDWGTPTYTWSGDFSECTATRVCGRDESHVETVTVKTTPETEAPTATENGKTTYTADFEEPFEDQTHEVVIPATGHTWGEPTYDWSEDNGTVTATLPCTDDPTLTVTETVETTWDWVEGKEATCEAAGQKIYKARFGNTRFEEQTKTVDVEALGHDMVKTEAKAATCEEAGNTQYWTCQRCGKVFSDEAGTTETTLVATVVPAIQHNWGVTYTWAENKASVVAVAICKNNPAHIVVDTVIPTSEVTTQATCETAGVKTFTAAFTKAPFETQTATEEIEALGHDWDAPTYTWAEDHTVTATAVCKRDAKHVVTETVTATGAVTTEATCEEAGVMTYTATFTKEPFTTVTKTEAIEKTGHDWGTPAYTWSADLSQCTAERVCKNDATHVESETKPSVPETTYDTFPKDGTVTTYTVDFDNEAFETQTKSKETASRDYKFAVSVSSVAQDGTVGSVTGIVYPDYQGVLSINGDHVSKSNITVGFWMNNVASLGVEGERHYERTLNTGMAPSNSSLSVVEALFEELHEATVIGRVEGGHSVTYTVVNEGRKITATPASENNARSVWHEIVNDENLNYGTDSTDDSSALIKAGSYIQVEDKILLAEKDVKVDNLNDLEALNTAIRDAVVYKTAEEPIEGVKAYVAKGTRLDMGTSYAEWDQNCMSITADIAATQEMKTVLQNLKEAKNVNEMMGAVFMGISQFCGAIDDTTTTVVFSFGHDLTKHEAVGATCEEAGSIEYYECENCGKLFTDSEGKNELTEDTVIAALGHDWGTPTYTWSGDFSECTATRVCGRDESHVETVTVKTTSETEEPTATENGKTTYTADFDEPFKDQTHEVVIPATGHTWGKPTYDWSEDNGTVTATLPCTDDPSLTVTETVETTWDWVEGKEATCEEPGQKIYKARFGNTRFEEQTKAVDVEALGHDWGEPTYAWTTDHSACTATSVCKRDDSHVLTENGTVTSAVTTPATCEGEGVKTYTATFKNETVEGLFETQTATEAIEKTGHDWGTPAYTWSEDLETVVAVVICKNNPAHIVVETANVTKTVTDPTCETAGSTVYTATFENELLETQTRTVEIPATGHDWGEAKYTWSEDHTTCTATTVCKNNEEHILTENGKVTSETTTPATCEEAGVVTYTATFEGEPFATQTATGEIKPLGHDWDTEHIVFEWAEDHSSCTATVTCKRDENHKQTLPCEVTSEVVGNSVIYTATVTFEGETYTDVVKVDGVLRIYGKDRYKTSLKVAEYYKEIEGLDKFEAVVIATGGNFPDALTGADLAIRKHAPLLMINASSAKEVTTYIKDNLADNGKVYVLGGQGAVEDAWIADLMSYDVTRLGGTDRFETNLSILRELEIKSGDLFICTGLNFADALSSSAIDMPILIVGGKLTENQKTFLTEGSGWNFHIVGGEGAVSTDIEEELKAYGTIADRTGGKSRYETSTALALKFVPKATQAVLAVGDNYPDGLCGGPVAYLMGAPVILSGTRGAMCGDGIKYAKAQEIYAGIVLGGPGDNMINDDTVRLTFSMEPEEEVIVYKPE